jgi:Reverse transcriptase (RNA-dependent DNA polymerase)
LRNTEGALKPESVSTKQERIAKLAAESPAMAFTSLNHYLDAEWLRYAYECTRKDGAVGVDGQTAQEYAADLAQNLQSLLDRLKSGRYRAPPVRRHYIDKSDGGKRALGIPSFEDKVAQRAIVMLLEPIYEQDFLNCSFGFRTGRNAHQALRGTSLTSASPATINAWPPWSIGRGGSGANGCRGVRGRATLLGSSSCDWWRAIRCQPHVSSIATADVREAVL